MTNDSQKIYNVIVEYLKDDELTSKMILNSLALWIFNHEGNESDLYLLGKLLDDASLIRLINHYDGKPINTPTIDELDSCLLLAITYYLKEIEGLNWNKIKEVFNTHGISTELFSAISTGRKLSRIKDNLNKELSLLIKDISNSDVQDILSKGIRNGK